MLHKNELNLNTHGGKNKKKKKEKKKETRLTATNERSG